MKPVPLSNLEDLDAILTGDYDFIKKAAFALAATYFRSYKHEYLDRGNAIEILEKVGQDGIPDAFAVLGDSCNTSDDEKCLQETREYYRKGAELGSELCKEKLAEWERQNM